MRINIGCNKIIYHSNRAMSNLKALSGLKGLWFSAVKMCKYDAKVFQILTHIRLSDIDMLPSGRLWGAS
jgi:hypothetical protein